MDSTLRNGIIVIYIIWSLIGIVFGNIFWLIGTMIGAWGVWVLDKGWKDE